MRSQGFVGTDVEIQQAHVEEMKSLLLHALEPSEDAWKPGATGRRPPAQEELLALGQADEAEEDSFAVAGPTEVQQLEDGQDIPAP